MSKDRLLFLCQTLPYPPDGGAAIRSYNVLRLLARDYDVTAMCFYRRATTDDLGGSLKALRSIASSVEAFPIEQEHDRMRLLWDHTRSVLTGHAYTEFTYDSAAFRSSLLQHLADRQFALVHVDSLDLSSILPLLEDTPVVLVHHNVESALLERRALGETSALRRAYLRLQSRNTKNEERRWAPVVDLNITVSNGDARDLTALVPSARVAVVPNGVDVDSFVPREGSKVDGIVFVGGMSWFPNADALAYFDEDILPLIRASIGAVRVTWVGRAGTDAIERYARKGITLTGHVDDIREYVYGASCYVVPLRVGGGTRLKILDAWAMGKAIVSTSVGCEGLEAVDGENILIRDDPKAFADAVMLVLRDAALRESLARNGRRTAERTYSWDVIGVAMRSLYGDLIAAKTH